METHYKLMRGERPSRRELTTLGRFLVQASRISLTNPMSSRGIRELLERPVRPMRRRWP